jgi:hypothetical protein
MLRSEWRNACATDDPTVLLWPGGKLTPSLVEDFSMSLPDWSQPVMATPAPVYT